MRALHFRTAIAPNGTIVVSSFMPPKIRDLIRQLERAGFESLGGKGSHRKFRHPDGRILILSGRPGADAKTYQIRDVALALGKAKPDEEA